MRLQCRFIRMYVNQVFNCRVAASEKRIDLCPFIGLKHWANVSSSLTELHAWYARPVRALETIFVRFDTQNADLACIPCSIWILHAEQTVRIKMHEMFHASKAYHFQLTIIIDLFAANAFHKSYLRCNGHPNGSVILPRCVNVLDCGNKNRIPFGKGTFRCTNWVWDTLTRNWLLSNESVALNRRRLWSGCNFAYANVVARSIDWNTMRGMNQRSLCILDDIFANGPYKWIRNCCNCCRMKCRISLWCFAPRSAVDFFSSIYAYQLRSQAFACVKRFSIPINWINVCSSVWAQSDTHSWKHLLSATIEFRLSPMPMRSCTLNSDPNTNRSNILLSGYAFARLNISQGNSFMSLCMFVFSVWFFFVLFLLWLIISLRWYRPSFN